MSHALRSMLAVGTVAAIGLSLSACSLLPFGNQTHSTSLKVGQCIQLPDDDEVGDITTANCAEEHTGEVYYILTGLRVKMCVWLGVSRGLDLAFLNAD